ncbi:MAG: O-antigen ligase family protein [Actinomycetota bacterium]|nr:O-antigen ligase family protein [Actinomycetota bacterium]
MREAENPSGLFTGGDEHREAKDRRPGRLLAVFKALVLLALLGVTAYGMVRGGLYDETRWLPVAAGILGLLIVTLFVRGFYSDLPPAGVLMIALLAALVAVKGLSMVWTISETETVKELLRSSMYLAIFVITLAALTSGRQVGPLVDVSVLIVAAVAGYGLLQKISPVEYPVRSLDAVRLDSTLGYVNTTAVVVGMGVTLALARMTTLRNFAFRGLYAALALAFLITLYLTLSRGGIGALGIALLVLFVLASDRLQLFANLLLLSLPVAWLLWRMQDLEGLLGTNILRQQKIADGLAFRNDLILALLAAFVLQAAYAFLVSRYELTPQTRRWLGLLVAGGAALGAVAVAVAVVAGFGGLGQAARAIFSNPDQSGNLGQRLVSIGIGFREDYWKVGWEAWKERPFTGTGAGTFQYTWLEDRPGDEGVKQVHNLYLEQGTETGVFAFLALLGFVAVLLGHAGRVAWRSDTTAEHRLLLAGLVSALVVYLASSAFEWHWYMPASTLFFFILAAVAAKLASRTDPGTDARPASGGASQD